MAVERRNPPVSFQQPLQWGLAGAERAKGAVHGSQPHSRPQQHVFLQIFLSPITTLLHVPLSPAPAWWDPLLRPLHLPLMFWCEPQRAMHIVGPEG